MAAGDESDFPVGEELSVINIFSHFTSTSQSTSNSLKNHVENIDSSESPLLQIPKMIRQKMWQYLSVNSRQNISQTCSLLREEIQELSTGCQITEDTESDSPTTFETFMRMIPFLPLRLYLDDQSWENLSLVCSELKEILSEVHGLKRRLSRWCVMSDLVQMNYREVLPGTITIFDIQTQDMKRIMSYLSESDHKTLGQVCQGFQRLVDELKEHPFEEYKNSTDWTEFNLMDLPSEVHEKILNFCDPADRARLRLVSKLMRYQVDTLAGVTVHLHDQKWEWNPFCGSLPPAHTLVVTNVENVSSINYFITDYNCPLLTRLLVDGPFLAKAMVLVAKRCKNLRYIGFTYALHMAAIEDELRKSFPVQLTPLELPSLKALNLKMREVEMASNNIFRVHAWSWANAFEFMKPNLFLMPRLTSFSICEENIFSHNLMHEVAEKILKFLVACRHTLKFLSIILGGNCFRDCKCPAYGFENLEEQLKEIKLIKYCHDCDYRISRPFTTILTAQTTLREISCFKLSDWEFYADVIIRNRNTLRSVKIEKNLSPVIDLSVFFPCKNLEHLWISQCGTSNIRTQTVHHVDNRRQRTWSTCQPRLIGIDQLPVNLKSLHILDQTADVNQIQSIPRRLKKLETLEIQFLGSCWGSSFGLSTQVILDILQLRNLNRLFLEEIRIIGDLPLTPPLSEFIAEMNLIPKKCSQRAVNYECVLYGVLIAEKMPSDGFLQDWHSRMTYFLQSNYENRGYVNLPYSRDNYYERIMTDLEIELEDEEEEDDAEDLYSNDASCDEEDSW